MLTFGPGYQHNVQEFPFPENVEPRVFTTTAELFPNALPFGLEMMKDRPMLDHRTLVGLREGLEVEIPLASLDDRPSRLQLRQLPPNVIRDVVVRFVKCIFDKVLDHIFIQNISLEIPFCEAAHPQTTSIVSANQVRFSQLVHANLWMAPVSTAAFRARPSHGCHGRRRRP